MGLSPPQPFSGQRVRRISGFSGSTTAESADSGGSRMASAQRTGLRNKWTNGDNRAVMKAYYMSNPDRYGYRLRMLRLWRKDHPNREMIEQRLADQRRVIERNQLLSTEELEDILRQIRMEKETDSAQNQPELTHTVESTEQPQARI